MLAPRRNFEVQGEAALAFATRVTHVADMPLF